MSPDVTEALLERETLAKSLQDEEEQARLRASALIIPRVEITEQSGIAGTLGETLDADARWGKTLDDRHEKKMMKEAEVIRHANLVRKLEHKLTAVSSLKLRLNGFNIRYLMTRCCVFQFLVTEFICIKKFHSEFLL